MFWQFQVFLQWDSWKNVDQNNLIFWTNILIKAEVIWVENKKTEKLLLISDKVLILFEKNSIEWMKYDKIMMIKYLLLILLWAEYHFQLIVNVTMLMIDENW